jgi:hypothetical protein
MEILCKDNSVLKDLVTLPPNEILNLLLKSKMVVKGNLAYAQICNFLISLIVKNQQISMMRKQSEELAKLNCSAAPAGAAPAPLSRAGKTMKAASMEPGVLFLKDDISLSQYSLGDFPRLERFLDMHFTVRPAICHERPLLLTRWFRENGFEKKRDGSPWVPELRQAHAFKYLMG